jgi:divalent metal cation (Fe/Co/Zn/Cd) transporter
MGIPIFDPLGGLVVSFMILKSGTDIMRQSTRELTDQQSLNLSEMDEIKGIINTIKVRLIIIVFIVNY